MVNRRLVNGVTISKKIEEMNRTLTGYWADDDWDIRLCPHPSAIELCKSPSLKNRWVRFGRVKNIWLRTELKYFFYKHIIDGIWNAKTVWIRKGTVINRMLDFLDQKYPNIKTITDVPIAKAMTEYRTFLSDAGVRVTITNYKIDSNQKKIPIKANSYYVTNLKQFMEFYEDFYFDGEEWEKDLWDRRKLGLPKDKVNPTAYEYLIKFTGFENVYFKELTKRYCKLKLNTFSFSYAKDIASRLRRFFNSLNKNSRGINRIREITRNDIEEYLSELNSNEFAPSTVNGMISILDGFFSSITKYGWEDIPSNILIFPEDYPKEVKAKPRFIDDYVLEQLNSKLEKLDPQTATMVMVIQECGMRISELCTLKKDCVITDTEGDCFLKYYQWKMKKEHIIPISRDVAQLIANQEKVVTDEIGIDCEYLFPRKDRTPLKQDTFRVKLNELAFNEKITDRSGEVFRFNAHAFRHTVGTKMINNGVPQHIVQKFLGHESPEMTSRYAHIFDETLKK